MWSWIGTQALSTVSSEWFQRHLTQDRRFLLTAENETKEYRLSWWENEGDLWVDAIDGWGEPVASVTFSKDVLDWHILSDVREFFALDLLTGLEQSLEQKGVVVHIDRWGWGGEAMFQVQEEPASL